MNIVMFFGAIFALLGGAFMFNAHNMASLVDNKVRKANVTNVEMLSKIKRENMETLYKLNQNIIDTINIGGKVLKAKDFFVVYGGEIVPEVGYKYKKALYLTKGVGISIDAISGLNQPALITLTNVSDNLTCKPGYIVNTSNIPELVKKMRVAHIDPYTLKDRDGNVKTLDELKTMLNLSDQDMEVLNLIKDKKCSLSNGDIKKSYMFVPKSKLLSISKDELAKYSSYLIDIIDKNSLKRIGYMVPLVSINRLVSLNMGIGDDTLDITDKSQLDQICDAGFYFDTQEDRCKLNIERTIVYYTFFGNVKNGKVVVNTNKIGSVLSLDPNKEYYAEKSPRPDWIEDGLYAYNGDLTASNNAEFFTGYTVSIWFTPKTDNSTIFKTNDNFKIVNDNGHLKVTVQGNTTDVGPLYKDHLYNILVSYDKITKRVGIYLNGNAIIKAEKNNASNYNDTINLGTNITLGKGNVYYMFKLWNEGFGDYLLDIIYHLEDNLGENYAGIPNPWFPYAYNGANICGSLLGVATIQGDQGIGLVDCSEPYKTAGTISMYNTFNKGVVASKIVADKGSELFSLLDDNNIPNINDINHVMDLYENNNFGLNASKAVNLNLGFNVSDNILSDSNGYTLAFVVDKADNGDIANGPFTIRRDNSDLEIGGATFSYDTNTKNIISITTNSMTNESTICVTNGNGTECKTVSKLGNGDIKFVNGIIDNVLFKPYAVNKETVKIIAESLANNNPSLQTVSSCSEVNNTGVYTINNGGKIYNAVCYTDDDGNSYQLVYYSIYSKFDKDSTKLDSQWPTIRGNGNIDYYSDIVDVCRQYNLKPFIVKGSNTDWYNKLEDILHDYTNYYNGDNWGGLAIGLWYDQAKEGRFNLDNLASNGMGAGTFRFKVGENLPDNDNGDAMDSDYRFASFWAGTDNKNGPEDWKEGKTLGVVCGGKEIEGLTPPISIADFDIATNDLDNRKEYIYTFDGTTWNKGDFYACPVGKVYDTQEDVCKEATDGNLVKVFDLSDAYKAGENLNPENNSEFNDLDHKYYTGDYLEGAYTGYDYDKIGGDYSKLSDNNPYDAGDGDTLYGVKTEGELCVGQEDDYQFAVDGGGTIEMDIKVGGSWYGTKKYGDEKAQKDKIDILTLHLKKGCYPVVMRYSASDQGEDNYVVWFNNGAGWDILKGNYLKMYKNEDYLNKDTEPTLTVTE